MFEQDGYLFESSCGCTLFQEGSTTGVPITRESHRHTYLRKHSRTSSAAQLLLGPEEELETGFGGPGEEEFLHWKLSTTAPAWTARKGC